MKRGYNVLFLCLVLVSNQSQDAYRICVTISLCREHCIYKAMYCGHMFDKKSVYSANSQLKHTISV